MKCILLYGRNTEEVLRQAAQAWTAYTGGEYEEYPMPKEELGEWCDAHGADILLLACKNNRGELNRYLARCRDLRIPYLFLTDTMAAIRPIQKILMPVTMLEEETHKAHICGRIARVTGAQAVLLKAHDYGTRARQHTDKIRLFLEKANIQTTVAEARKDSFSLYKEVPEKSHTTEADLIVLTASREYGLDDILFGPPERHILRHTAVPVMLLNPRSDLYTLCD